MSKSRILFIVKRREDYSHHHSYSEQGVSTGLWNSARLVVEMLNKHGVEAKLVEVIDNNCIDREVTQYKPTDVIIEALWVVPEKFEILTRFHPKVKWNIRLHSELPFMANEGIAMGWLSKYVKFKNVTISANSLRMLNEIGFILAEENDWTNRQLAEKLFYTPNYYMPTILEPMQLPLHHRDWINIGCFGAIRPLKNQLIQAVAALKFADSLGKRLEFHINIGRIENKGDPVYKNIVELFDAMKDRGHKLITHQWTRHDKFIEIMRRMDIGMQVSFTETFNIVAADMVACGIPMVVSSEISWAVPYYADPTSSDDIVRKMKTIWFFRDIDVCLNRRRLKVYSRKSIKTWLELFK